MTYPNNVYPADPDFPISHEDVPLGPDFYTATITYLPALVTDINLFVDHIGNIEIAADKGIEWDGTERIALTGGEIEFTALQVNTELVVDTITVGDLTCTGDLIVGNDLDASDITVTGTVTMDFLDRGKHTLSQIAEPGDPADNTAILWLSDSTGAGDEGDLMCKITEGGGTSTFTIADYSAL